MVTVAIQNSWYYVHQSQIVVGSFTTVYKTTDRVFLKTHVSPFRPNLSIPDLRYIANDGLPSVTPQGRDSRDAWIPPALKVGVVT